MDLKEKILRTSLDLMMRIGPQSVTMDMVARDCGISKRTLYETFPNKHNLICDVIEYNQQQANAQFTQIFEQSANSFEALMGVYTGDATARGPRAQEWTYVNNLNKTEYTIEGLEMALARFGEGS